jgi:hypothetical protein
MLVVTLTRSQVTTTSVIRDGSPQRVFEHPLQINASHPRQFEDPLQLARVRPSFLKSRFKSTPTTLAVLKAHFKFEWSPHVITRVHTT